MTGKNVAAQMNPPRNKKEFTPEDFVSPDSVNLKTIRPFRPGEFVDNGDGSRSTERSMSFNIEGKEVLTPSLWMTPDGPVDLSRNPESLFRAALAFEKRTGKKFPRFNNPDEATRFSKERSSGGGRGVGPLAR